MFQFCFMYYIYLVIYYCRLGTFLYRDDLGVYLSQSLCRPLYRCYIWQSYSDIDYLEPVCVLQDTILCKALLCPYFNGVCFCAWMCSIHHVIKLEGIQIHFVSLVGTKHVLVFVEVPLENLMKQLELCL